MNKDALNDYAGTTGVKQDSPRRLSVDGWVHRAPGDRRGGGGCAFHVLPGRCFHQRPRGIAESHSRGLQARTITALLSILRRKTYY